MHSYLDLFVVNQHIQVIQGNLIDDLSINQQPFHEGDNILNISWEAMLIKAPDLSKQIQILHSIHSDILSMHIINIPRSIQKDGYIIRFSKVIKSDQDITNVSYQKPSKRQSKKMEKIMNIIEKISSVDSTVLLLGETGVGKTWLARYIHQNSARKEEKFISINCSTLPESLIESELFGYEAGTFTGGNRKGKTGLLETANHGIVFLDEIGELPLPVQSKLLEVLQDGVFRRIGGEKNIKVNIRFIAATNRDLQKMVKEQTFREDLFYRLHVVPIIIPSLQERKEEIIPLAEQFISFFNNKYQRTIKLDQATVQQLLSYHWPGNIRELENTIERYVVTQHFPSLVGQNNNKQNLLPDKTNIYMPLKEAKNQFEKEIITRAYEALGTTYRVAEALEVNQSTIAKKLKQYRKESD